ncbi:MAG: HAD family hydrolase [Roseiflexaceae bacterium]
MVLSRPPRLVIFDKDGTLIDFQRMWGYWAIAFAERISQQIVVDVRQDVLQLYGVDPQSLRIDPQGALSISPMATMQQMVVQHIMPYCSDMTQAYQIVQHAWQPPDPTVNVYPTADLLHLFGQLRQRGVIIAVATADNRQPTIATLAHLGVMHYVAALACADDSNMPPKPAPDKIWAICRAVGLHPHDAIMIGDTPADMQMGHNAGVMAQIGVTSGVSTAHELTPWASWVIPTVADIWQLWPT